jgi:hypothetical protein
MTCPFLDLLRQQLLIDNIFVLKFLSNNSLFLSVKHLNCRRDYTVEANPFLVKILQSNPQRFWTYLFVNENEIKSTLIHWLLLFPFLFYFILWFKITNNNDIKFSNSKFNTLWHYASFRRNTIKFWFSEFYGLHILLFLSKTIVSNPVGLPFKCF